MAIAGRVAIVPKGDWSSDATYKRLDAVTHNNTLYFAKKDVPAGTATSNTEYWSKSVVGGEATVDDTISSESTNPVQNKVVKAYVDKKASENIDFSTSTSKLLNGSIEAQLVLSNATRNLLNPTLQTITQDGVTFTNNGDGTYTLNGTSTKDRWISFAHITLNPGKYKFIATENNVEFSNLCVTLKQTSIAIPGNIFTIQSKSVCDIGLSTQNNTFNNVLIKPMLTTDLSATYDDFVPYSGYDIKTCGKNLLNPTLQTTTKNGITCTNNGDGTYTFNGTSTADGVFFDFNKNIAINKGTKYKVVCFKDEDYIPDKIRSCVRRVDTANAYVFNNGSFVSDTENCWMFVSIAKGVTVLNLVAKPMITTDLSATYDDFESYKDGGTVHIDSTTEFPLLGLKSFDGETNIISPGNVEVTYAKSDSGKTILDMSKNKLDKDNVVNNQTTTEAGFALDARQANPNIDGSLAKQISDLNGSLNYVAPKGEAVLRSLDGIVSLSINNDSLYITYNKDVSKDYYAQLAISTSGMALITNDSSGYHTKQIVNFQ